MPDEKVCVCQETDSSTFSNAPSSPIGRTQASGRVTRMNSFSRDWRSDSDCQSGTVSSPTAIKGGHFST